MQSPVLTIKVYGTFLAIGGAGLVFFPNDVPPLVGMPAAPAVWVQLIGLANVLLAIYYWSSALANVRHFFVTSVYGRFFFSSGCIGIVVFASAPWPVAIFGLVSLSAALWTRAALLSESVTLQGIQADPGT